MSDAAVRAAHREAIAARAVWLTALESGAERERTAELFDIYLELLRVAARRAAIAEPGRPARSSPDPADQPGRGEPDVVPRRRGDPGGQGPSPC